MTGTLRSRTAAQAEEVRAMWDVVRAVLGIARSTGSTTPA
jgi:hypothetical protein